jgi:hypothetical protein
MAAGVTVFTNGRTWVIGYTASAAAGFTLPYTLCPYDLIPKRIVLTTDSTSVADGKVIIQSQPVGGTATDVYRQGWQGADANPAEQRPNTSWSGPIVVTQFDVGAELLIDLV